MNIAIKALIEVLVCVALIITLFHEDKFIKFERDCVYIIKCCRKNHIGLMDFVRIVISAARMTRAERGYEKEKVKSEVIIHVKRDYKM